MPEWSIAEAPGQDVIVFALARDRLGLSIGDVESISPPPPLRKIPHAGPALLGAGNLGGQIIPVLDLSLLLGTAVSTDRSYDGRGEIIRVRSRQGSIGLWVDRVERLAQASIAESGELEILDPAALLKDCLTPPSLGVASTAAIEPAEAAFAEENANAVSGATQNPFGDGQHAWVLVEIAGVEMAMRRADVAELLETVRWTPVPGSPPGLLGVAVLRRDALPVVSLSHAAAAPASFARIHCGGPALLALDRINGLRGGDPGNARLIELETAIPSELQAIIAAFAPFEEATGETWTASQGSVVQYLSFRLGGQQFALPAACIERVVEASPLIPLPRLSGVREELARTAGAIEIRGQIVPVAATRPRLGLPSEGPDHAPAAYAVIRTANGLGAVEIDEVGALAALPPGQILPPPPETELLAGIARVAGSEPLRLIAPEQLWGNL